jgi:hypothetical protein
MALSDRDIIITPNRGASSEPIITLRGADAASSASMVMRVINSGSISTLSFEGTSGQLFAVSDTLSGSIFSVNDVSGIPSIEVLDTGDIKLAEWNGKVRIGGINNNENATSTSTGELQVVGGASVWKDLYVGGGMTVIGTLNAAVIAGSISNAANATNAANVAVTDDPNSGSTMYPTFVSATSGNQAIRTDSNGLVWVPSTNRLGIGTSSPTTNLHVYAASDPVLTIQAGGGSYPYIQLTTPSSGTGYLIKNLGTGNSLLSGSTYLYNSAGAIQFVPNATQANTVTIDTSGQLGIGTGGQPSLLAKLHISNSTPSGATSVPTGTDLLIDSSTNSYLTFRQSADIGAYGGIQWVDNNAGAYITFRNYSTGGTLAGSDSLIYGTYQDHIFQAGTSGTVNGKTEVLRITQAGFVGIGTPTPDIKLDVRGTDSVIQAREDGTSATWRARILSRNSSANKAAFLGTYASIPGVFAHNYALNAWSALYINTTSGSSDGDNVIIAGSGNVGIGNNAPGRKLDVTGVTNVSSHITQGTLISRPNVSWGASGTSTGAVVIKFPGTSGNYGMVHVVIDIYTYDGEHASTVIVGGHNWNGSWYNFGATRIGAFSKGVRVAFKDSQYAIVLGTNTSTWSYGQVVVRKIQNGSYYSGVMDLGGTYTIAQDAAAESYSYISGNLITAGSAGGGGWNSGNDGSGSGLDADLLDGLDSTQFLRRDVTNSMFAGQTSQLSFENQGTFFRFAFNDLRFYDWNNGADIFGLDDHAYATTSMRAPIFYDRNDTAFYIDPASSTKAMIVNGNIELTARSESWAEGIRINVPTAGTWGGIRINRSGASGPGNWAIGYTGLNSTNDLTFYSGTTNTIQVNLDHSANLSSIGSMRAPIFYDSNDTAYYLDPAADLSLRVYGEISNSNYVPGNLQPGALNIGRTDTNYGWSGTSWSGDVRAGILANCADNWEFAIHDSGERVVSPFAFFGGGNHYLEMGRDIGWGSMPILAANSFRAPIFYDRDNTGYYVDPASTTNVNNLTVNGTLTYTGTLAAGVDYARRLDNATRTAISVGGNASTYYPVVLQIGAGATVQQYGEFVLERGGYDDPGYTGVNFSTFNMRMSVKGSGWGFGSTYENCEALYQNVQLVANWQQVSETSRLIIWLRGATVYYLWNVVGNTTVVNANGAGGNIVDHTYTFTPTTTINAKAQHSKYFNNGAFFDGSTRAYSLGVGTNASGTDGRLDVSSDVRAPIYYDSNDTAYYVDPASGTRLGYQASIAGNASGSIGNRLLVGSTTVNYSIQDTNLRPTIHAHGQYPVLSLNHTVTSNTNHGPTLQFTCNGTGNQFVIGTNGTGSQLDMGYSSATDWNPHNGIAGYNGVTFFRANTSGNIGLGAQGDWGALGGGDPGYAIDTRGTLYNNTDVRAPIFYDANNTGYYTDPASTSNLFNLTVRAGSAYAAVTDLGFVSPIQVSETGTGTSANRYIPMISGTSSSPSGYRQHTVFGSLRDSVWGSAFIAVGGNDSYPTTAFTFHYGGYGSAPDSWRAPVFYDNNDTGYYVDPNSTSNLSGLTNPTYTRFDLPFRKFNRSAYTSDQNYWTGTVGWGAAVTWDTAWGYGHNGFDIWGTSTGHPQGTGYIHAQGIQSGQHYATADGAQGYGWQMVGATNATDNRYWARGKWGSGLSGWKEFAMYGGNVAAALYASIYYDANDTGYYADPNGTSRFGNIDVASRVQTANYYDAAIEVREYNYGGSQVDATYNYPRIGFHWGGRVASSIAMSSNGWINIMNNPGTGYESIIAAQGLFTSEVTAYYSDIRLKTKVGSLDNAVEKVKSIETFKYVNNELANSLGFTDTDVHIGVSAQSVEAVLPEVVKHAPFDMKSQDGETISASGEWYKTVQYDKLVPLLIEAIKEQQTTIDELRAEMQELKEFVKQSLGK